MLNKASKILLLGVAVIVAVNLYSTSLNTKQIFGALAIWDQENERTFPVPFIIVVCCGSGSAMKSSLSRQKEQIAVLFKSLVFLTETTLRFVVVTDSQETFDQIESVVSSWPETYRKRLILERREVWYPPGREQMKGLLRPCSSARLFLPDNFTDIDSAIYLDTDILFLAPPEELLEEMKLFDDKQAVGMAQASSGYSHGMGIPFPKPKGLNTGVILMNLTRLRALSGGWGGTTLRAFDKYRRRLSKTATNDIINIVLGEMEELYYPLECVWNFGPRTCVKNVTLCPESQVKGVSILHGTTASFIKKNNSRLRLVFKAWKEHPFGSPITSLITSIEAELQAINESGQTCKLVEGMKFAFTEALRRSTK